jgi:hypothetical protein
MKTRFKHIDRKGAKVRLGDRIRLLGFNPSVVDQNEFKTRTILKKCVGRTFVVKGFQKDWVELHLGRVIGKRAWEETIWTEPEYIEVIKWGTVRKKSKRKKRNNRK